MNDKNDRECKECGDGEVSGFDRALLDYEKAVRRSAEIDLLDDPLQRMAASDNLVSTKAKLLAIHHFTEEDLWSTTHRLLDKMTELYEHEMDGEVEHSAFLRLCALYIYVKGLDVTAQDYDAGASMQKLIAMICPEKHEIDKKDAELYLWLQTYQLAFDEEYESDEGAADFADELNGNVQMQDFKIDDNDDGELDF